MYNDGIGVKQDYKKAIELYTKSCDGGDSVGCYHVGYIYAKGQGVEQDLKQAKEFIGKACDLGNQESCEVYRELNEAEN
ncbi:hypothetical protein CQA42_06080 [Helicobacter sp. MIT 99-5507]|nr:hypothetical protein CQA42_06080 [Helicobacter sp. MIT 99-5507]